MNNRLFMIAVLAISVTILSSCQKSDEAAQTTNAPEASVEVVDLDAATAAEMFERGDVAILDVRTPEEFATVHLEGATLVDIRGEDFDEGIAALDHSKPYLVHCAAGVDGGRSRKAVDALIAAGAKKVYHLDGGINAWVAEDHPVAQTGE